MIDAIRSEDPIRSKIEALGTTLSLPTVRKALGVLEGTHASDKRFGADDVMDIRIYEPGDEAKRIDWKTSARVGRPMVVQRERPSTSRAWLLLDVGQERPVPAFPANRFIRSQPTPYACSRRSACVVVTKCP